MKSITIKYFASMRELSKHSEETIDTNANTAEELYQQLQAQYHFPLAIKELRVAVNDQFSDMDYELQSGDELVFIPPMSGG